jgi:hypothetical protein
LYQSDVGRSLAFAASPDLSAREAVKKAMEDAMPKYLFEAQYSADGAKGVVKEGGTPRRAAVARMAESVGGKLESFISPSAVLTPMRQSICRTTQAQPSRLQSVKPARRRRERSSSSRLKRLTRPAGKPSTIGRLGVDPRLTPTRFQRAGPSC